MINEHKDETEQRKELDQIAELAADRYDLQIADMSYFTEETNTFYKITDVNGKSYALKIFQEESSTLEDNQVEIYFVNLVSQSDNISIPSIVSAKDGSQIQTIHSKYASTPKRVVLYTWVNGEDLDENENDQRFIKLGELTAQLHNATYRASIPTELSPRMWNKVFYYKGEEAVYKHKKHQKFLSSEFHDLMDHIIPYLNEKLSSYYENNINEVQLIHADLNPWNVRVDGEDMHILDFDDVMLGLPIHDFSNMLYYYRYNDNFDYHQIKKLFLQGYEKVRELPHFTEFDLELLMTGRRVNFMNYNILVNEDPKPFIETSIPRVKDFLKKYEIHLDI
ncbi:phosphotransferase enzyme family protein [Chengkuizengella axinellae]|uniref:Phosphotransferase n=1 Tax=Chengkuizengella axinellae TaxID=3064388 RepID=A0ABT9J579_9BACL|nr:phosphotransferase [Chengkuizengella sp. 2205SS18-9]MDP5276776.1 phosphotransferase [Chengkuizengella sp. 2205SS18-9]